MKRARRRGVASVVGTVFFVLVFMLALGALAYDANLQAQTSAAQQQGVLVASERGSEDLAFGAGPSGLEATDTGPATLGVEFVVLRFPNGTVYPMAAAASIPSGGMVSVRGLIPAGTCAPGTASCLSKYDQVVSGSPEGSSVGIVTSFGNVFWYTYSGGASGWGAVTFSSSGTWSVPSGVSAAYVVCVGGGGGGGGSGGATYVSGASGNGGGGGGGVGSLAQRFVDLGSATAVTVTIGQGGAGGTAGGLSTNGGGGGSGGSSSFGAFLSCGGGQGGGGSYYNLNGGTGSSCGPSPPAAGGSGGGVPGGTAGASGVAANALQQTTYGGGGGGGSSFATPPGAGSPSSSFTSGVLFTGQPGTSGLCALGGGGGSASPFGDGGRGGNAATSCGSGQPGGSALPNTGAGGGGAGGSYSSPSGCGTKPGEPGGSGGSGVVVVYYQH